MDYRVQSVTPKIEFFSYKDYRSYQVFSATSNNYSGQNLLSYSFSKSVDNFSGSFQITIREESDMTVYTENDRKPFLDKVHSLDVVKIIENGEDTPDFIGVVTTISFTATEGNKTINISGHSLEYLLEFFTISLDATAMAWANTYVNVESENRDYKSTNGGSEAASIKDVCKTSYNYFCGIANQYKKLSNSKVMDLIDKFMGSDIFDCQTNLKFKYPIASNILQNSTITWSNYIRNLLPQNVYELYGINSNGKVKIRAREVPFNASDWVNLRKVQIQDYSLINYTLTKSIDEVYTNFYSYVEGSSLSPDFWNRLNATSEGNVLSETNMEKTALYGYKPLQCNFIGYNTDSNVDIKKQFLELNKNLADWYGKLDEMYDATITVVNIEGDPIAAIGEVVKFLGGEFYVVGAEHSWQYGVSPKVTYHCERGGKYSNGKFSELTGISLPLAELNGGTK